MSAGEKERERQGGRERETDSDSKYTHAHLMEEACFHLIDLFDTISFLNLECTHLRTLKYLQSSTFSLIE